MAKLLQLAQSFIDLRIAGSITPAGALMAIVLLLALAEPKLESPWRTLLYRFSSHYQITQQIEELHSTRRHAEDDLRDARRRLRVSTRLRTEADSNLANATELRNGVRDVYLKRWENRHALRDDAKRALNDRQRAVEDLGKQVADLTRRVAASEANETRHTERLQSIDAAVASLRQQRLKQPPISFGGLFETVLMVGLLGWAIGIVLNPVNKGLLELSACSLGRAHKRRPNPALYYIGKNVITQEDYDALLRRYHRFAQISVSLVLPLLALAWVLSRWPKSSSPYGLAFLVVFAALLWYIGARRYRVFHQRVRTFIAGRLRFVREQRRREKKKDSTIDLTPLAHLVAEAKKLLSHPRSCCCPKCRPPLAAAPDAGSRRKSRRRRRKRRSSGDGGSSGESE